MLSKARKKVRRAFKYDAYGNENEIAHVGRIMREGTGVDRQIDRGQHARDLKAVIDHIVPGMKSRADRLIWIFEN